MAERRWEVPLDVAREARRLAVTATGVDAARLRDIGGRMPVGRSTLLALLASGVNGKLGAWATHRYAQAVDVQADADVRVRTTAGIETPTQDVWYGITDGDTANAVIRAGDGGTERWPADGWRSVPTDLEPTGLNYMELAGDVLTDALAACADGHSLLLRAATPKAFLPKRIPLTATAGASDGVYAAVDEVDTTAVLNVFQVADGVVSARDDGEWVPDRDTLTHLLAAGVPLALLPQGDVPPMLRQIDDHDAVFPIVAADVAPSTDVVSPIDTPTPETATPDFSDGVMVALPLDDDTAQQLAVPGGLDPSEMHVTLAYLGNTGDCPVDADGLAELVAEWAADQQPLSGEVSGPATFEGSDNADNPVQVALADVPGLSEARNSLVDHLGSNGVTVNGDHGYTAHISRAYSADPVSTDGLGGTPLDFGQVGVWHGTDQRNIPLGPVTAAFNPSESRDPTGKWTAGGGSASQNKALEANRKTTAPHAAPTAKTVVTKPYKSPAGGGGGGGGGSAAAKKATAAKKAAASKAAQVQKTALRDAVAAKEKAASAAETALHQKFNDAQAASLLGEQQHRIDYMRKYAAASPAQRKAMRVAEAQRRLAWQTRRAEAAAKETARHTAATKTNTASKTKLDAQLKAQIAAIDAQLAKQFPSAGTPAPAPVKAPAKKAAPVKASAEPLVADVAAHTRIPHQLETYWTRSGPGAAKIRWGESGDFNRCRAELGKYVHSDHQVSGLCANLHKIAIGVWPGREHGSKGHS